MGWEVFYAIEEFESEPSDTFGWIALASLIVGLTLMIIFV